MLEALAHCGTAAFDKTGTLTTGKLAATSMREPGAAAASSGGAGGSSQQQCPGEPSAQGLPWDNLSSAVTSCMILHYSYVLCQPTTASSGLFLCNHKRPHKSTLCSDKGRQPCLIIESLQVIGLWPFMMRAAQMM